MSDKATLLDTHEVCKARRFNAILIALSAVVI